MNRLPDIQDAFQRYLLAGHSDIAAHVIGTGRVPIDVRLGIYGNAYRSRLIEALEATFPVLAGLLGESDFADLGSRYVEAHPSTFFSVRHYGDRMADFLSSQADYAKAPVLAEVARWEWAMAAVFDAADAVPVDPNAFADLAPEEWAQLRFDWSPSLELLELQWNTPELWKAVTEESERPDPALNDGPVTWLLWRQSLQIFYRPLGEAELGIIRASRDGRPFGELCELLCEHVSEEEASLRAAGFLRGWVESGLITGLTR